MSLLSCRVNAHQTDLSIVRVVKEAGNTDYVWHAFVVWSRSEFVYKGVVSNTVMMHFTLQKQQSSHVNSAPLCKVMPPLFHTVQ